MKVLCFMVPLPFPPLTWNHETCRSIVPSLTNQIGQSHETGSMRDAGNGPAPRLVLFLLEVAFFLGCRGIGCLGIGEGLFGAFLALKEVGNIVAKGGVHQTHIGLHRIGN